MYVALSIFLCFSRIHMPQLRYIIVTAPTASNGADVGCHRECCCDVKSHLPDTTTSSGGHLPCTQQKQLSIYSCSFPYYKLTCSFYFARNESILTITFYCATISSCTLNLHNNITLYVTLFNAADDIEHIQATHVHIIKRR